MKKIFILVTLFSLSLFLGNLAFAKMSIMTEDELMAEADLVISGEVIKVEQTEKIGRYAYFIQGKISYATIRISRALKGEAQNQEVIVEFITFNPLEEAENQDTQFALTNQGVAYLKKLDNGHYRALGGWGMGWDRTGRTEGNPKREIIMY